MQIRARSELAVICVASALLCGCSSGINAPPWEPAGGATALSRLDGAASQYQVVYDFHGQDGARPTGGVIPVNGLLYGTTTEGGTHGITAHDGVAYSVTPSGNETVLHDFGASKNDGTYPMASLLEVKGVLYGTTGLGDASNTGTVFSLTIDGKERVLYSFGGTGASGSQPSASLIDMNGLLYSTTNFGGYSNVGTAFSVTTSGAESTIHSFGDPYKSDGEYPSSRLLDVDGTLYGTTYEGGIYGRGKGCGSERCPGYGTVFSINSAGKVHVLHSFGNGSDGISPEAGLIDVQGTLYGTTVQGGSNKCGTVFTITTTGSERVLYSFAGAPNDGCEPSDNLIDYDGWLYGTTGYGGAHGRGGTVFAIQPGGGGEHLLHSFGSGTDGKNPAAALHDLNGTLYGTTENGGTASHGTVFALKP